jgi:hypothetical protein
VKTSGKESVDCRGGGRRVPLGRSFDVMDAAGLGVGFFLLLLLLILLLVLLLHRRRGEGTNWIRIWIGGVACCGEEVQARERGAFSPSAQI